jgi:hypothetical protein
MSKDTEELTAQATALAYRVRSMRRALATA